MSDNIDRSRRKEGAFVSYKEPAWHQLGTVLNHHPNYREALELGGLDYEVRKSQVLYDFGGGVLEPSKTQFFTWRTDTNLRLGDVGHKYHVVQNEQAFQAFDLMPTLDIETAGAIDWGRIGFMSGKFGELKVGNDLVNLYVLVYNGHDGKKSFELVLTPVRVVCYNTLQAALAKIQWKFAFKHTENWQMRMDEAIGILDRFRDGSLRLGEAYNQMANTRIKTDNQFFDYLANIFLTPKEMKELKEVGHPFQVLSPRKINTITAVIEFAHTGIGQDGFTKEPNMWLAYNAVTGYYNYKGYKTDEDRFVALTEGSHAKKMEKALVLAAHPERIRPLGKYNFANN